MELSSVFLVTTVPGDVYLEVTDDVTPTREYHTLMCSKGLVRLMNDFKCCTTNTLANIIGTLYTAFERTFIVITAIDGISLKEHLLYEIVTYYTRPYTYQLSRILPAAIPNRLPIDKTAGKEQMHLPLNESVTFLQGLTTTDLIKYQFTPDDALKSMAPWITDGAIDVAVALGTCHHWTVFAKDVFVGDGPEVVSYTTLGIIDTEKGTFTPMPTKILPKAGIIMSLKEE